MKEAEIKALIREELESAGWVCWFPPQVKFYRRDIFGVFDVVALLGSHIRFVQFTTKSHLSHRRRKIQEFLTENDIDIKCAYVYAYDKKAKKFIKEKVTRSREKVELQKTH